MKSSKEGNINGYSGMVVMRMVAIIFLGSMLTGCFKSEYTRLVERELASNTRHDSLFLGMHFGMTKKEFFDHCWALNREHILTMGTKSSNVLYSIKDSAGL